MKKNKIELLAPAGNMEKLKMAILYGADAVYVGGEKFGLRAYAGNFTKEVMKEAVDFVHQQNKKLFVTVNIYAHNQDLTGLEEYLLGLEEIGVDALIVADPGIVMTAREVVPNMELHLSTQANNTNYKSSLFWHHAGVKRIVLARELSFEEISEIRKKTPETLDFEIFVHGAMCMSYSGRCLMSNYLTGRDSNHGQCAHPCRYKYYVVEEQRPGQYMPVEEDERGTYIFNSKDMCMIEHIPELIELGVSSLKIEGRMKSAYYVATVVRAYRKAIDAYLADPPNYVFKEEWLEEVNKASHREFSKGFFEGKQGAGQVLHTSEYVRDYMFIGLVKSYNETTGIATIEQRNKMEVGDLIEIMGANTELMTQRIEKMVNQGGEEIQAAPHPQQIITMPMKHKVQPNDILRRQRKEGE